MKSFRFRREILNQSPPLERFLVTISSIWCHLWKSTQARPMPFSAQFSALESSVDTPTAWAGEHVLAPPFFILNSETFPDILFSDKQLSWSKWLSIYFLGKRCRIITKWMKPEEHEKQTLTFLHAVLPTWEQTAKSSKRPTAPSMNYRIT